MTRTLLRLCFKPTPADRYWRGWINILSTVLAAVGVYLSFVKGQPWGALSSGFMVMWNGVNIYANFIIWHKWKYKEKLPWFLDV